MRSLQLTLAILKPDVVAQPHIVQEIRTRILNDGFYFVRSKHMQLSKAKVEEFYEEHRGKFFVNRLICFMSSGPIWAHILARDDAIKMWRQIMGPTKVLKTVHEAPSTIRGQFGLTDTRNCTHGSDSEETAEREIKFFFPDFDSKAWHQDYAQYFAKCMVKFDKGTVQHVPAT